MIVGLTGGIASGKSTVSRFFKELGLEILDADELVREVSQKKDTIDKIAEVFGRDILDGEGKIIREKLREKAFENRELLKKLNEIIHPQVIEIFVKKKDETPKESIVIFDIPLLYEAEMENLCDKIIVVYVERELQTKRVMERDNNSRELAEKIIEAQMALEEKAKIADIVINNNSTLEDLKNQVNVVYCNLQKIKM
ncbi:dephospho-CoA kinase [Fusobacterium sp. PH5-7]|uniref:dephospho-CoA kinase n=1 Tax=Fusobacterium sp. PH5-7 TaxID=2940528 RepID=UPI00247315B3|nr:dephospho-CoA kinase [Fusobacterium sp. PH5-7]MDH6458144.1 dephospho-CoA kinase [Fusobacterium sp. PH5-7]